MVVLHLAWKELYTALTKDKMGEATYRNAKALGALAGRLDGAITGLAMKVAKSVGRTQTFRQGGTAGSVVRAGGGLLEVQEERRDPDDETSDVVKVTVKVQDDVVEWTGRWGVEKPFKKRIVFKEGEGAPPMLRQRKRKRGEGTGPTREHA